VDKFENYVAEVGVRASLLLEDFLLVEYSVFTDALVAKVTACGDVDFLVGLS